MPDLPLLSKTVDQKHSNEDEKCGLKILYYIRNLSLLEPLTSDCKRNVFSERLVLSNQINTSLGILSSILCIALLSLSK